MIRIIALVLMLMTCHVAQGDIRVLVWNVQRGANHFDQGPEKALKVIRDSGADLVLMQESYDIEDERPQLGHWLAKQLGWNAHQGDSPHLCILTRYEIMEAFTHAPWHGVGARLKTPEMEMLVWTCWIDYRFYLPYHLSKHPEASVQDLLECETKQSDRAKQSNALLARLKELGHLDSSVPLLVGGDWNSPSHLDYDERTRHLHRGLVVPIPTSLAFAEAGFVDGYREVYPNPLAFPGATWSPLYKTNAETGEAEPQDRIDRLYLRSDQLVPVAAKVLPEEAEDEAIPQKQRRFPSDHAAVLFTLTSGPSRERSDPAP